MNEITDTDLGAALSEAFVEATKAEPFTGIHYVSAALRKRPTDDEDPIHALIAGLDYHFIAYREQRANGPYGPMMEGNGMVYPIPLDQMTEEVFQLWARAVGLSPNSLMSARFADLLWEARFGAQPVEWAQIAIDKYLVGIAEGFGHHVELKDAGARAFELVVQINDGDRKPRVIASLIDLLTQSLGSGDSPGVALPILDLLATSRAVPIERLGPLLDTAIEVYGTDPWHLESALEIKAKLSDPADHQEIRRAQVEAFVGLARRSAGIAKFAHLQRASEMAQQHGLRELADQIRVEMESISEEELGLQRIRTEVEIPRKLIDRWIAETVGDDNMESALERFGSTIATDDPERAREFAVLRAVEFPLQSIIPRMILGPENALLRVVHSEDSEAQSMIEYETFQLAFFGEIATEILAGIQSRYGPIADMAAWFEGPLIEASVTNRIGRAIELYEQGDYDDSAHVLVPRLERIVRGMARGVGLAITRGPGRGGYPGGVRGLGNILEALGEVLPEASWRYLTILLAEVTGLNLRNRISHGLVDRVTQQEAALLLHAACHLALLSRSAEPIVASPEIDIDFGGPPFGLEGGDSA